MQLLACEKMVDHFAVVQQCLSLELSIAARGRRVSPRWIWKCFNGILMFSRYKAADSSTDAIILVVWFAKHLNDSISLDNIEAAGSST